MASHAITSGGKERIDKAAEVLAPVFRNDPVITYMLCSLEDDAARVAYLPAYFHTLFKQAALNQASFSEIAEWKCCTVMLPPGKSVGNLWTSIPAGFFSTLVKLGLSGINRMLFEFEPKVDAMRAKALPKGEECWYFFFVGTREDSQGQGLASDLIRHHQNLVREGGLPIWLEATTPHSRDVYARLGFQIIDEIVLGKGNASADGRACKGGEGVPLWGMIWRPEGNEALQK